MADHTVTGRFDIDLNPSDGLLPHTGRFDFTKTWTGEIAGTSVGVMLSAGDPSTGTAGYVALERFEGTIAGKQGSVCFQQCGTMADGEEHLTYVVVPGSGTDALLGVTGTVTVDADHHVTLHLS